MLTLLPVTGERTGNLSSSERYRMTTVGVRSLVEHYKSTEGNRIVTFFDDFILPVYIYLLRNIIIPVHD